MPDQPDQPRLLQGSFRLQYSELPEGRLQICFSLDEILESGPIVLERAVVDELVLLLDRATALMRHGCEPGDAHANPAEPTLASDEEHDERAPPLRTDPAALSRKRRPPGR